MSSQRTLQKKLGYALMYFVEDIYKIISTMSTYVRCYCFLFMFHKMLIICSRNKDELECGGTLLLRETFDLIFSHNLLII